mgnify:CR=1 FL=1
MKNLTHIWISCLALLVTAGCNRSFDELKATQVQLPVDGKVRSLRIVGDSVLIVGGDANSNGFALVSDVLFESVDVVKSDFPDEVYDIVRHHNKWYVSLDSVGLFTSDSLPGFHRYWFQQADWVGNEYKQPLRRFASSEDALVAVGGGELAFGTMFHSIDTAKSWRPQEVEHEMRAVGIVGDKAWAGGDGALYSTELGDERWTLHSLADRFVTDIHFTDAQTGYLLTTEGEVMKTTNAGQDWERIEKPRNVFMHSMIVSGENLLAHGADGHLAFSGDSGANWQWFQLTSKSDLVCGVLLDGRYSFGTDNGKLEQISLEELK